MSNKVEITDYYELVALYRALLVVKFDSDPLVPELLGSPFIANIVNRVAKALDEKEIERGHPERVGWSREVLSVGGGRWESIVKYAARSPEIWIQQSHQWKVGYSLTLMSPFSYTDEIVEEFIRQVEELTKEFVRQRHEGDLDR